MPPPPIEVGEEHHTAIVVGVEEAGGDRHSRASGLQIDEEAIMVVVGCLVFPPSLDTTI
jgi:hypothetical protein